MREERKIVWLKQFESINFFFLIPLSYSTILQLRWYCSYMSKKIWTFPIWPSCCWDFLGLYAKCIYAGDALSVIVYMTNSKMIWHFSFLFFFFFFFVTTKCFRKGRVYMVIATFGEFVRLAFESLFFIILLKNFLVSSFISCEL